MQRAADLVGKISSPETLAADKHGDTYMGGALHAAIDKARSMAKDSDACTMTFIVMFTDGWDERLLLHHIRCAMWPNKFLPKTTGKRKGRRRHLQTRVVGLQRLPDSKAAHHCKRTRFFLGGELLM